MTRHQQLSLFDQMNNSTDEHPDKITYNDSLHVTMATFKGGINAPFHNWFRLTPSFGPQLVHVMLDEMEADQRGIVLDPFAGAGTTLIEAKLRGLESYGFEINPVLYFVSKTSTNWNVNISIIEQLFLKIQDRFFEEKAIKKDVDIRNIGIPIPPIHNVFRWWREDVLKDLLILRNVIDLVCHEAHPERDFFRLGLMGVLVPDLTNVTLGRLQLHFIDRTNDEINVWQTYASKVKRMISDIKSVDPKRIGIPTTVFNIDSTQVKISLPKEVDYVITSPPYPNRYSYVWNTRPHLYFFGYLKDSREASELDKKTIGGTWGTATSCLKDGKVEPLYPIIQEKIEPIAEKIRASDNLMANYVMKYFNAIAKHIVEQDKLLSKRARCAYVIGCSRIKGVYIESDVLLGEIFEGLGLGYRVHKIERFRKRHSGKDLYESIVYVYK